MIRNYAPTKTEGNTKVNTEKKNIELPLLNYILEMRYLSFDQIKRRFELGSDADIVVSNLITKGLLRTKDVQFKDDTLFRVTPKAQELIQKTYPDKKVPQVEKNIFQPRVRHDLLLNDLRIRFEDLGFISKWVSERQMKEIPLFLRSFQDFPDAVCVKKNSKSYFLELEVSGKGPKQYRERIASYLEVLKKDEVKEAGIEGVIFFCINEDNIEKIKKEIPEGAKGISVLLYENYFKIKQAERGQAKAKAEKKQSGEAHV